MPNEAQLRQEQGWNQTPVRDVRWSPRRNVSETREHGSVQAFLRGQQWYSQQLFSGKVSKNTQSASRALISSSRRLLTESRILINKTRNTLIFSRSGRKTVN